MLYGVNAMFSFVRYDFFPEVSSLVVAFSNRILLEAQLLRSVSLGGRSKRKLCFSVVVRSQGA